MHRWALTLTLTLTLTQTLALARPCSLRYPATYSTHRSTGEEAVRTEDPGELGHLPQHLTLSLPRALILTLTPTLALTCP